MCCSGFLNMISGVGHDIAGLEAKFGLDNAIHVTRLIEHGVKHVKQLIKDYKIECDMQEVPITYPALVQSQLHTIKRLKEATIRLECSREQFPVLNAADTRQTTGIDEALSGFVSTQSALVNPFKLTRGILNKVVKPLRNVSVFERSPVSRVDRLRDDGAYIAHIDGRTDVAIKAPRLVIATNAYTSGVPGLSNRFAPVHVVNMVTRPLTEAELDLSGGISKGFSLYTFHEILLAIRLTADRRILLSSGDIRYASGDELHNKAILAEMTVWLEGMIPIYYPHFNHLNLKAEYSWEGVIAINLNDMPCIGEHPSYENLYHSLVYNGHGVALANISGRIIADLVANSKSIVRGPQLRALPAIKFERNNGSTESLNTLVLVDRMIFPIPQNFLLRRLIFDIYVGVLRWHDRSLDVIAFKDRAIPVMISFETCYLAAVGLVVTGIAVGVYIFGSTSQIYMVGIALFIAQLVFRK